MLIGNQLFKQLEDGSIVPITTDDIPEGLQNKYNLDYVDGKIIGDIVVRFDPKEWPYHARLDGSFLFKFEYPEFYNYVKDMKDKAIADTQLGEDSPYAYFNKTEEEYEQFLTEHADAFCPYFVINEVPEDEQIVDVDGNNNYTDHYPYDRHYPDSTHFVFYEVINGDLIGYTRQPRELIDAVYATKVSNGYIYNLNLECIDIDCSNWVYVLGDNNKPKEIKMQATNIHLPTTKDILIDDSETRSFYSIVIRSAVPNDNDEVSFRSVAIGTVTALDASDDPIVEPAPGSTMRNQVWNFGIPKGKTPKVEVGTVVVGDLPAVEPNEFDDGSGVTLNFTIPRGEKGEAGSITQLDYLQDEPPLATNSTERWYNTSDNKIYVYRNSSWEVSALADAGIAYIYQSKLYYYNGTELINAKSNPKIDAKTIQEDSDGALNVGAVNFISGDTNSFWLGKKSQYDNLYVNSNIDNSCIYFIIEDDN